MSFYCNKHILCPSKPTLNIHFIFSYFFSNFFDSFSPQPCQLFLSFSLLQSFFIINKRQVIEIYNLLQEIKGESQLLVTFSKLLMPLFDFPYAFSPQLLMFRNRRR